MSENEKTVLVDAHYEWVYEITGSNGKALLKTTDALEIEDELGQLTINAARLGFAPDFTVRRRKRLTAAYLSDWEVVDV